MAESDSHTIGSVIGFVSTHRMPDAPLAKHLQLDNGIGEGDGVRPGSMPLPIKHESCSW